MSNQERPIYDLPTMLSRRGFIKAGGGCAALTSTSILSTLSMLQMTKSVAAAVGPFSDYKAIVCLFLFGGNDSMNWIAPHDTQGSSGEYDKYVTLRGGVYDATTNPGGLALTHSQMLNLNDDSSKGGTGKNYAFHPLMGQWTDSTNATRNGCQQIYNAGKMACIANIGSLIRPTTRTDYNNNFKLPLGLFSHSDEQRNWQTSLPHTRSLLKGWAGRMADILNATTNSSPTISMSISLNSSNTFQIGNQTFPYIVNTAGTGTAGVDPKIRANAVQLTGWNSTGSQDRILTASTNGLLAQTYQESLAFGMRNVKRNAVDAADLFNAAITTIGQPAVTTVFPSTLVNGVQTGTSIGNQLKAVAQMIASRNNIGPSGQQRQIFFVNMGGYDNHDNLIGEHNKLLPQVNQAVSSFYDAMVVLGQLDNVVLFTASDFNRTGTSNGKGSDHAWGSNQIMMGGPIRGGRFYGSYPELISTNPLDVGRGRYIPTTSVDQLAAELALWFGIPNDDNLVSILPNIRQFYASGASTRPLQILS